MIGRRARLAFTLAVFLLLAAAHRASAAEVAPERYAELVAVEFGEIVGMCDFSKPGDPEGFDKIPALVTPRKPALAPFLQGDPPDAAACPVPAFLGAAKPNALRHATKGICALAFWLARKGKHAESFRLLSHASALSLLAARSAARPWADGKPGGGLLPALISVALRKVTAETAGAAFARCAADPAGAKALADLLVRNERACPDLVTALSADLGFSRATLAVLRAADPARPHSAWLKELSGQEDAYPLFPPGLEKAYAEAVQGSPEARVVADLFWEDASREIALYEARVRPLEGKRHAEAEPLLDALDADLMSGRVFRNLYVMMIVPNLGRASAQTHRQRARADLLGIASALRAAGTPPESLPADLAKIPDALADGAYGYERAGDRFLVFSAGRSAAAKKTMIEAFRAGKPPVPTMNSFDEGPAFRSDFGFVP